MRISARTDLGGYGATAPAVVAAGGIEITKPFVLLCGPNGSGKTAILRMMRAAIGLAGERAGQVWSETSRPIEPELAKGDLGKLAAFERSFSRETGIPKGHPGVLDAKALGWEGQPTWLFDSRAETKLLGASSFGDDMMHHVSMIVGGGNRISHGQMLRHGWTAAVMWALGLADSQDPYEAERLPPAREQLFRALVPGARSAERWLLLDEPETALDAETLALGLCTLVENAEMGRLKVFCASHSPVFAAGLVDHPSVQVIDLGSPRPWLETQKRALAIASELKQIEQVGATVGAKLRKARADELKARQKEQERIVRQSIAKLGAGAADLLIELKAAKGNTLLYDAAVSRSGRSATETLERRKLVERKGFSRERELRLTNLGVAAAELLSSRRQNEAPAP